MYKANEFSVDIWPDVVRIHQSYEEEGMQTIEITADQVGDFCAVLKRKAEEATALGREFAQQEQRIRIQKSLRSGVDVGEEDGKA